MYIFNSINSKIIPIIAFVFLIGSFKLSKNTENNYCLNIKTSNVIKGFSTLFILFVHLSNYANDGSIFIINVDIISYFCVAYFFFISGYGLFKQLILKENYLANFIRKRILKIFIPYIFATLLFFLFYYGTENQFTLFECLSRIIDGDPIVSYSWFIIVILILYTAFYIISKLLFNRKRMIPFIIFLFCIALSYALNLNGFPSYWSNRIDCFAFGMFYVLYERNITNIINNNKILVTIFLSFFLLLLVCLNMYNCILNIVFVLLLSILILSFNSNNSLFLFINSISLEIYIFSGLVIKFVRMHFYAENGFFAILVLLAANIIFSYTIHHVFNKLKAIIKHQ